MSGNWTKGPWVVDPLGLGALGDISTPDGMQCVAQSQQVVGDFRHEVRTANAHLIAAAPDMADLLAEVAASLHQTARDRDLSEGELAFMRRVDAALAKTRGEA